MGRAEPTLGLRLRARRIELGLTLAQVAERAKLSLPYVSNLERGRGNPTIDALSALATALDLPVTTLLADDAGKDSLHLVLAEAPKSLLTFSKSQRFTTTVERLATQQGQPPEEMRRRLLVAMASAPRRSQGEPNDDDWRRLLDVYSLILSG